MYARRKNKTGIPEGQFIIMRGLLVCLAAFALMSCGGSQPQPSVSRAGGNAPRFGDTDPHEWQGVRPWQYQVHGIDVSKYQGSINWPRVRASGVNFAFIKATEGDDHSDERFIQNWNAAANAGVARGAYHYYYFCSPPAAQAAWFMNFVPRDQSALPPVLDLEWTHKSKTCRRFPEPATVRAEARTMLQILQGYYHKRPIIYTTVDFYRDNELWKLDGFAFWLRSVAGHPSEVYPNQKWAFWQYTGTGVVEGIDGTTDLNVFAGNQTQWLAWLEGGPR